MDKQYISHGQVFTVSPSYGLLSVLADHLLYEHTFCDSDLDAGVNLSHVTLLLPTKRAISAMRDSFLARSMGKACILPQMRALGDVDPSEISLDETSILGTDVLSLPPIISPLEREFLLAREVEKIFPQIFQHLRTASESQINAASALKISRDLLALLDSAEIEQITLGDISKLVASHFAENWQLSVEFLKLITRTYPEELKKRGLVEPLARRNQMMAMLGAQLESGERAGPIIAAGSTGSTPATRELLRIIATHAKGAIILPGLDPFLDEETWDKIGEDHPQFAMKNLLEALGRTRADVKILNPSTKNKTEVESNDHTREQFMSEVMRPASDTDKWVSALQQFTYEKLDKALSGVSLITAPSQREEALAIALCLREVLETPGKTAALVTPDRQLALRVIHEMKRWRVEMNDSAGRKLSTSLKAKSLLLIAGCIEDHFSPVSILSLLRHELITLGLSTDILQKIINQMEIKLLRGPRPAHGLEGVKALLNKLEGDKSYEDISLLISRIEKGFAPFEKFAPDKMVPCADLCRVLLEVYMQLNAQEEGIDEILWAGEDGEMLAHLFHDIFDAEDVLPEITAYQLKEYLQIVMDTRILHHSHNAHPRLYIYGLLEARLMSCDLIIMGGLNEGVWPQTASPDPWLNRPMRADLGLPAPERRIGLSAHDFVQNFCAKEVVVTRAEKVDGVPSVASRWVLRLKAVLEAVSDQPLIDDGKTLLHWASMMDKVEEVIPALPPRPTPPVATRPRSLSVTKIETWQRDPYAIYASRILKLKKLPDLDAEPGYGEKGTLIHKIMERYILEVNATQNTVEKLLDIGAEEFEIWKDRPSVTAFWLPRFERIARWVVPIEQELKQDTLKQYAEVKGAATIKTEMGDFTLTGIADRIDVLTDGSIRIMDYKTGALPGLKEVGSFASQMPLQAYIAMKGGYEGLPKVTVSGLAYMKLSGAQLPGLIRAAGEKTLGDSARSEIEALVQKTVIGLKKRITQYAQEGTPYLTRVSPKHQDVELDYDHLSRYREWAVLQSWGERI